MKREEYQLFSMKGLNPAISEDMLSVFPEEEGDRWQHEVGRRGLHDPLFELNEANPPVERSVEGIGRIVRDTFGYRSHSKEFGLRPLDIEGIPEEARTQS